MPLLYTYYGDDFTGSTDVLEQLASNGVPSVLFLTAPTPAHLAAFPNVQAIGIAGDSRSRTPEWMSANLPPIFATLKSFQAPVTHYKVCSTFDSSPTTGSIGRAIEIGRETFAPHILPIVVGAPHLRRYVAFGNLFAAAPDGQVHRIDRHPMSRHPITPMREPDLRLHLAAQTHLPIGLIDSSAIESNQPLPTSPQILLFDTIDHATQTTVGTLLWREATRHPLFSASSSGLTAALITAWRSANLIPPPPPPTPIARATPLLIVSGSCSAATERQLRYALAHGYIGIPIGPAAFLADPTPTLEATLAALTSGRDTVLYTALGTPGSPAHGDALGQSLGQLLHRILTHIPLRRVLLCGGDTSSHAVQQLGLYALTWAASLQPGAPLCHAHADSHLDGFELVLKGGQVGTDDFFNVVRGN